MRDLEKLRSIFLDSKGRENSKLEIINDASKMPFHILSFVGINEIFFVHEAFVKNDFQLSKIYLHKIGMTYAYYHEKLNGEVFEAMKAFTYPILSDNSSLIERFTNYKRTQYSDSFPAYFGKSIQSVLVGNNDLLKQNVEGLKKWSKKGWSKNYSGVITVFDGLFKRDKETIETGLSEIILQHGKQNQPPITGDYINLEATTLAKLALIKGIDVNIDSPLIPKELLPISELAQYEGYKFFDELE